MTDCTILAALGSGCDVMDHAVTQMPYAFTVALVSIFCIISATLGFSAVYTIALGALVLGHHSAIRKTTMKGSQQ